jgi:hypothetical protein
MEPHLAAARLDERPGRRRVEMVERHARQAQRGVARPAAEHPREHLHERRGPRLAHRLIERGERQRLPQHLDQPRRLAVADQPGVDGLLLVAGAGRARAERGTDPGEREPIAPGHARPAEHAGGKMQRRRKVRAAEHGSGPRGVDEPHLEARLQRHERAGADVCEEAKRFVVAPGEHVLAVVDPLAGLPILECARAAAEPPSCFEDQHLHAGARELDGRGEPGEPATDDGHRGQNKRVTNDE